MMFTKGCVLMEMERIGVFGLGEVFSKIVYGSKLKKAGIRPGSKEWKEAILVPFQTERHGIQYVKMNSLRYKVFERNQKCVKCGLRGEVFILEKGLYDYSNPRYHFNLYARTPEGLMLMTKDHIKPISAGGKNDLWNLQTMCSFHNAEKADRLDYAV